MDTLVFISSDGVAESMGRHHEHVVAASMRAGVRRVVYTSIHPTRSIDPEGDADTLRDKVGQAIRSEGLL